jgi:hypothetical protein
MWDNVRLNIKESMKVWTGCIKLRTGPSDSLLLNGNEKFWFHEGQEISYVAE